MRIVLKLLFPLLILPFAGCLNVGLGGASLAPGSAGVQALDGGLIGQNDAAKSLSNAARAEALDAEFQALQYGSAGQAVQWSVDGYSGEVVPTQLYRVGSQDCRGYSHTFKGKAQSVKAVGTACKTTNGLWKPLA